jgi:cation:H+ antiporter
MITDVIFLAVGLLGLWVGADLMIKGVKNIGQSLGISDLFMGLAFVSIGTSIPEIAVSVAGAFDRLGGLETSGVVVGNALGSSIVQISLFIGVLAFLVPLVMDRRETLQHGSFLIASIYLVFGLSLDGMLTAFDGAILVGAYVAYYILLLVSQKIKVRRAKVDRKEFIKDVVYAVFGLAVVLVTADIVVDGAVSLATGLGVKQSLIGLLVVGFGTGLPEFSVAIASARNRVMAISMGDLIGSNICDLLLSLGLGTIIAGFVVDPALLALEIPILVITAFLLLGFLYTRGRISKREGAVLVGMFLLYAIMKLAFLL